MKIVTIKNEEIYEKNELEEFNNLADRPTEFIRFIALLCEKYKLCLSKISESNSYERNLGVELTGSKILIQFFYEYDNNTLELAVIVDNEDILRNDIKNDILTYVNKVSYKIVDRVIDNYGEKYIIKEDIIPSHTLRKYKAVRIIDNEECWIYNNFISPEVC